MERQKSQFADIEAQLCFDLTESLVSLQWPAWAEFYNKRGLFLSQENVPHISLISNISAGVSFKPLLVSVISFY